jgi:succinate dehydrogenase/fumarate reductase flavoprotein subunit
VQVTSSPRQQVYDVIAIGAGAGGMTAAAVAAAEGAEVLVLEKTELVRQRTRSGVRLRGSAGPIVARKGVVLATGGFAHSAELRQQLFPAAARGESAPNRRLGDRWPLRVR